MNEADLIIRFQNGDYSAFDEIFEIYKNTAMRTAYLITGSRFASEDITQEAFIICYYKIKKLKNPACFKPWLFKIVTRLSWKYCKKDKIVTPVENIFEQSKSINNENCNLEYSYDFISEYDELYDAINKLDKKSKTTIILFYFNEFSISEISNIMGCFEGTVKSRLYNSRKKLKNILSNSFDEQKNKRECAADEKFKYI